MVVNNCKNVLILLLTNLDFLQTYMNVIIVDFSKRKIQEIAHFKFFTVRLKLVTDVSL